jgi:hypothetical protein
VDTAHWRQIKTCPLGTAEQGLVVVHHSSRGADSKVHFAGRTSAKCLLLWYFLGEARKYR